MRRNGHVISYAKWSFLRCLRRYETGRVGCASESLKQRIQHALTVLASSRDVASYLTKDVCALGTAKAAGHLLLDLDHANVSFGQIVVKRDAEVVDKRQYLVLVSDEPVQQVSG